MKGKEVGSLRENDSEGKIRNVSKSEINHATDLLLDYQNIPTHAFEICVIIFE